MRSKIVLGYLSLYVIFLFFGCVPNNRRLPKALKEVSGVTKLADGQTYWLNDGGNGPIVFSSVYKGEETKSFRVPYENVDWEGLTSYQDSLLCICDIGDNRQKRDHVGIAIVNTRGDILQQRKLYYPFAPFNAEACAIKGETFYILTKARFGSNGAEKINPAYLLTLDLQSQDTVLAIQDELDFPSRSVTDMAWQSDDELVIVGYNYKKKALFGKTPTTVYTVEVGKDDHFRQNTLRAKKIRAPFTWTQYESILPIGNGEVLIASEKTIFFPARWRAVSLPK
ncbi:MAG: hypothetical protein AB8F78_05005 [Saprospiraceae bacterium]